MEKGKKNMKKGIIAKVRETVPLIHNITNYVTVNDVANILLACGGSPIMADDAAEVEEITSICGGLCINIGTLNSRTVDSMRKAGKRANALGHTVVLDPVGAGASAFRTDTAKQLLEEIKFTVIRKRFGAESPARGKKRDKRRGCRFVGQCDRRKPSGGCGVCKGTESENGRGNCHDGRD